MNEPPPPYSVRRDERIGWWRVMMGMLPCCIFETRDEAIAVRDRLNAKWIKDRDEQENDDE